MSVAGKPVTLTPEAEAALAADSPHEAFGSTLALSKMIAFAVLNGARAVCFEIAALREVIRERANTDPYR